MPALPLLAFELIFAAGGFIVGTLALLRTTAELMASQALLKTMQDKHTSRDDVDRFLVEVGQAEEGGEIAVSKLIGSSANTVAQAIKTLDDNQQTRIASILSQESNKARRLYLVSKLSTAG